MLLVLALGVGACFRSWLLFGRGLKVCGVHGEGVLICLWGLVVSRVFSVLVKVGAQYSMRY